MNRLRNIATSFLGIAALIATFISAPAAQAESNQSFDFGLGESITKQAVMEDNSLFVWGLLESGSTRNILIGYFISPQGVVGPRQIFDTINSNDNLYTESTSFVKLKSGKMVFAWSVEVAARRSSYVKLSSSANGSDWSAPIRPVATAQAPANECLPDIYGYAAWCGYKAPVLAEDGKGRLGIALATINSAQNTQVSPISFVSSTNLQTFTKPVVYKMAAPANSRSSVYSLVGMAAGGFAISFGSSSASQSAVGYAIWEPGKSSFTSPKQTLATGHSVSLSELLKFSSGKYIQFFKVTAGAKVSLSYLTLDTKTKSWSKLVGLKTEIDPLINGLRTATDVFGTLHLVFQEQGGVGSPKIAMVKVSVGGIPTEPMPLATVTSSEFPLGLAFDANNNPKVFMRTSTGQVSVRLYVNSSLGNPEVITAGTNYFNGIAVDRNGNASRLYIDSYYDSHWYRYQPDEAPRVIQLPTITGTAKVGKIVTSSVTSFKANNGSSANAYQWYSCSASVPLQLVNNIPSNCSVIQGAANASYSPSAIDVGSFLAVGVSSTNTVATTQVLSKSSAKVVR